MKKDVRVACLAIMGPSYLDKGDWWIWESLNMIIKQSLHSKLFLFHCLHFCWFKFYSKLSTLSRWPCLFYFLFIMSFSCLPLTFGLRQESNLGSQDLYVCITALYKCNNKNNSIRQTKVDFLFQLWQKHVLVNRAKETGYASCSTIYIME